jgi:EAL domain-containing protein (putative c-di-GMP-specific phosphodiesterase class I)
MAKKFSDLQCEYIQGFYYSKPLPRDEFVSFLRQAKSN